MANTIGIPRPVGESARAFWNHVGAMVEHIENGGNADTNPDVRRAMANLNRKLGKIVNDPAHEPAEVKTVAAAYQAEMTKRGWHERDIGGIVPAREVR